MLPKSVWIRNFTSYGDEGVLIDFSSMHLVVFSGPNGVGKSSVFEAMSYALWGETKLSNHDDLMRHGSSEMVVDLCIEVGEEVYHVIRRRKRRPSGSVTTLELKRRISESFEDLTEAKIASTQGLINRLVGMSYDVFSHSAFLRQGRADDFVRKKPFERKALLSSMLNLSMYQDLERSLKDEVKVHETRLSSLRAEEERLKTVLAENEGLDAQIILREKEIKKIEKHIVSKRKVLQSLQREQVSREDKKERNVLKEKKEFYQSLQEKQTLLKKELDEVLPLVKQADLIVSKYAQYRKTKELLEKMEQKRESSREMDEEASLLQGSLDKLTEHYLSSRSLLEGKKDVLKPKVKASSVKKLSRSKFEKEQSILVQDIAEINVQLGALDSLQAERSEQNARLGVLKEKQTDIATHLDSLGALSEAHSCPLCSQELTKDGVERVVHDESRLAEEVASEIADVHRLLTSLDAKVDALSNLRLELEGKQQKLRLVEQEISLIDAEIVQAESLKEELQRVRSSLEELEESWKQDPERLKLELSIKTLRSKKDVLGYDEARHKFLRQSLSDLESFVLMNERLETAKKRKGLLEREIEEVGRDLDACKHVVEDLESRVLEYEAEDLDALSASIEQERLAIVSFETELKALSTGLGSLMQRLKTMKSANDDLVSLRKQLALLEEEVAVSKLLVDACSKNGIPSMMLETALPRLEEEANLLLSKMTEGRLRVQLSSVRQSKSGTDVDTLDIDVFDGHYLRPIETYSGGEAFRIHFALRIALSKILAWRSSRLLKMVVIDEGFGSQDDQGRERLVEAIFAIKEEFDLICVVTHIDRLREMFDQKLLFEQHAGGTRMHFVEDGAPLNRSVSGQNLKVSSY